MWQSLLENLTPMQQAALVLKHLDDVSLSERLVVLADVLATVADIGRGVVARAGMLVDDE